MDGEDRSNRVRSFLIGGLVGASAVFAAARRGRRRSASSATGGGLPAFEDAPCYRELEEKERDTDRSRR